MPLVGFEPTISAGELPKTYALDRTTPRICTKYILGSNKLICIVLLQKSYVHFASRFKWLACPILKGGEGQSNTTVPYSTVPHIGKT